MIAAQGTPPTVIPPSTAEYIKVYNRAARNGDAILSIHASRELYNSWHHAREAAQQFATQTHIAVIDSQTICTAQGLLVRLAAESIGKVDNFDQLVRKVRGGVERVYSLYYVENLSYLLHHKILSPSHGILGMMLGIKPFLTIEEGRLLPIEKVRSRLQAVERMLEFMTEFEDVHETVLIQPKPGHTEQMRLLLERLSQELPNRRFSTTSYTASLAALIGTDAHGLVILEDEFDDEL